MAELRDSDVRAFDGQNRISVPANLRDGLGEKLIVFAPPVTDDRYLVLYPVEEWEAYCQRVCQSRSGQALAKAQRRISNNAYSAKPDKQGRITVKEQFKAYANLTEDAFIIGVGNRVELWNPDAWSEQFGSLEEPKENLDDVSL